MTDTPDSTRIVVTAGPHDDLPEPLAVDLPHGAEPAAALARALAGTGWLPGAWVGVRSRTEAGEQVVELHHTLRRDEGAGGHPSSGLGVDGHTSPGESAPQPGLEVIYDVAPVVRQRLAVYAVVEHDGAWLLTEHSDLVMGEGRWGLPGGGVDVGEDPLEGLVREVWEETGQLVDPGEPLAVQSAHWTGPSPSGVLEDFHAVRLILHATCADPTEPVVHDVGGTTASARWVPRAEALALALTPGTRVVLDAL